MDVRSKFSIGASMLAAGFGCAVLASVSWGGGERQPASAATLPQPAASAVTAGGAAAGPATSAAGAKIAKGDSLKSDDLKKLSIAKDLNLEPGLLDQRVRLSGRAPDAPMSAPPSEPSMTRRDFLRLKDRVEAKENWMFVDQEKLNKDREKSTQDDVFKDKWELKQDLKKREWWEYGNKNSTTASSSSTSAKEISDPSQMDDATRAQVARKLRDEDSKSRESLSPTQRTGKDSAGSTHQYSALSMKELFQPGADSKTGRGSELGLNELFGNNSRNSADRDPGALRRQEFRDFLNVSRVPKPAAPVETSPSALSPNSPRGGFSDSLQTGLRPPTLGREGLGMNGAAEIGRGPGASGFGSYYDMNRSGATGPQANSSPSFRGLESSRNLITPSMMEPPKRRF